MGGEVGKHIDDRALEYELAAIDQDHDGGAGDDGLGQRGQIVDGVGGDRAGGGDGLRVAGGVLEHGLPADIDPGDGPGNDALLHGFIQQAGGDVESRWADGGIAVAVGHSAFRRWRSKSRTTLLCRALDCPGTHGADTLDGGKWAGAAGDQVGGQDRAGAAVAGVAVHIYLAAGLDALAQERHGALALFNGGGFHVEDRQVQVFKAVLRQRFRFQRVFGEGEDGVIAQPLHGMEDGGLLPGAPWVAAAGQAAGDEPEMIDRRRFGNTGAHGPRLQV